LTSKGTKSAADCDAASTSEESDHRNCGGLGRHLIARSFLFLRLAVSATGSASASSPTPNNVPQGRLSVALPQTICLQRAAFFVKMGRRYIFDTSRCPHLLSPLGNILKIKGVYI